MHLAIAGVLMTLIFLALILVGWSVWFLVHKVKSRQTERLRLAELKAQAEEAHKKQVARIKILAASKLKWYRPAFDPAPRLYDSSRGKWLVRGPGKHTALVNDNGEVLDLSPSYMK